MRLSPRPPVVDAALLVTVLLAAVTGLTSMLAGQPGEAWIVATHSVAGVTLLFLLLVKVRRVVPRLSNRRLWSRAIYVSLLTLGLALGALLTGIVWVHGGRVGVGPWTGLTVHAFLGVLLVVALVWHLRSRFRFPQRVDFEGRRTTLQAAVLVGGGVLAWRLQQAIITRLDGMGAARRFTGSRPVGDTGGNDFPVTSWVADDPPPIALERWRLRVDGAVENPFSLTADDLRPTETEHAVLDCTSGWFVERPWSGIRVGRLLEQATVRSEARWVRFRSVTGYRWSLPLDEARQAILATHVDSQPLSHGHGAPLRLVAPGRRGFQWVKWVDAVEVLNRPDYGQWFAIFASGFTREASADATR